jgi:hypothetical protein
VVVHVVGPATLPMAFLIESLQSYQDEIHNHFKNEPQRNDGTVVALAGPAGPVAVVRTDILCVAHRITAQAQRLADDIHAQIQKEAHGHPGACADGGDGSAHAVHGPWKERPRLPT